MKTLPFKDYEQDKLPLGLVIDGKIYRDFEYKKLTGKVRKKIGIKVREGKLNELMSFVLSNLITKIGPIINPTQDQIKNMFIGDQNYICLLFTKLAERGGKSMMKEGCRYCTSNKDLPTIIEFPVDYGELPINFGGDDIKIESNKFYKEVTLEGGEPFSFYLPTVGNIESYSGDAEDSFERDHSLLASCIKVYDGIDKWTVEGVEELSVGEIDELIIEMSKVSIGPDLVFLVNCPNCKRENQYILDLSSFFVSPSRRSMMNM